MKEIFRSTDILIPSGSVDLEKWAVVACDQYTSEPEYWENVKKYVGDSPSAFKIIYPECYLNESAQDKEKRIDTINNEMKSYLSGNIFQEYKNCFVLLKRTLEDSSSRLGLIGALDLEEYGKSVRPTEETILSRIPPRKEIRKNALLESPHIMVLINDFQKKTIEPLWKTKDKFKKIYDFTLMQNGGKAEGYLIDNENDIAEIKECLSSLSPFFAIGDGNHSFATAKSIWDDIKVNLSEEERKTHPARFCLVELENIFDDGLKFEPINRVLFNVPERLFIRLVKKQAKKIQIKTVGCKNCIAKELASSDEQIFGYCTDNKHAVVSLSEPKRSIAAASIQNVIDILVKKGFEVDYIHGLETTDNMGSKKGCIGIFLPAIDKNTFFESIEKDGLLPRKTFSMGEANGKRFYLECRKITL